MNVKRYRVLTGKAWRRLATAILLALLSAIASHAMSSTVGHAQRPDVWTFEGRVYEGRVGDESHPVQGVSVEVYGSNNPFPDPGEWIADATTDERGRYRLDVPAGIEFYSIRVSPPSDYEPVGATTVGGIVRTRGWIEYTLPLERKVLTDNKFWLRGPARAPVAPDLTILSADNWDFEDDGRLLVLHVDIVNQGTAGSPATPVLVEDVEGGWTGWGEIPHDLAPGEVATADVWLEVSDEQRGRTYAFRVIADPEEQIQELDEDNNVARTPGIPIPAPEAPLRPTEPPPREPRLVATPTPEVEEPGPNLDLLIWGAIIVVAVGLALVFRRVIQRQIESQLRLMWPTRLTTIWLTEGTSGTGRVLADHEPLVAGTAYSLHLQVQPRGAAGRGGKGSQGVEGGWTTPLDVAYFSPETDFVLERRTATLELPLTGASPALHNPIIPREAGKSRLRACIYYRNVLLQSVLLEASVLRADQRVAGRGPGEQAMAIARTVDYVASTHLLGLEELHPPALSIFTNQGVRDTHWIGAFASGAAAGFRLRTGAMHTFGPGELFTVAGTARDLLAEVAGKREYRLAISVPLDVQRQLDRLERDLVRLAVNGYTLYDSLFFSRLDADDRTEYLQSLEDTLRHPSIISVARCSGESTSIPWAALYDHYLDTGKIRTGQIKLCEIFKYQLAANRWTDDMGELLDKDDLLDEPDRCRSNPQCPLQRDDDGLTVCPFGFWGFLHQIEQPLQYVDPTPVDQVPEAMKDERFNQTSYLVRSRGEDVRMTIAAYPKIPRIKEHQAELRALAQGRRMNIVYEEDRDRVVGILSRGGHHLYYFYCHGEEEDHVFKLKLGPGGRPGYIAAADLDRRWRERWPRQPQPLVILNACDTVALTPELIHGFLGKLKYLGACGVVGTEVKVWSPLAQSFGSHLMKRILEGRSVGEAFLDLRRHLLRQFNPLGLAYTYYSPATLHLHEWDDGRAKISKTGCAWCRTHPPARLSRGNS